MASTSNNDVSPPDNKKCWTLGVSNARTIREAKAYLSKPHLEEIIDQETGEFLEIHSHETLLDLVQKICNGPVKKRREIENDYSIEDHLWKVKIVPYYHLTCKTHVCNGLHQFHNDDDFFEEEDCEAITDFETKMDELSSFHVGSIVSIEYDFGSTTNVYMHVLSEEDEETIQLTKKKTSAKKEQDTKDIESIPAFKLPKDKQIDSFFPHFCKMTVSNRVETVTMGLSHRIAREHDSLFCSIQSSGVANDLLYCPMMFEKVEEFLALADQSFCQDLTENGALRESFIARFLFPPSETGKAEYEEFREQVEKDEDSFFAMCGPKQVLFHQNEIETPDGFSFQASFPKTYEQMTSGKFRWFKYSKGCLNVAVGRGSGENSRQLEKKQILRTWKRSFQSFHEMLCAVEASWNMLGDASKPLGDTILPEYDNDLGPSKPLPEKPTRLAKASDMRIISEAKKLPPVSAMAIGYTGEGTDKPVLYTGHRDGSLKKWNLHGESNDALWSISAFNDLTADYEKHHRVGVAGISIKDERKRHHLVFTWSHVMDEGDFDVGAPPSEVRIWNGHDGSLNHKLVCKVDVEGNVPPTISTLCMTPLWHEEEDKWITTVIVGLHATCPSFLYQSDFSDFDYEEAIEGGEGNIIPYSYIPSESSQSGISIQQEETWRSHGGFIRAMSVVHKKFILSLSEQPNRGLADELILWSAKTEGTPLCKLQLNKPRNAFANNFSSLEEMERMVRSKKYSIVNGDPVGMTIVDNFVLIGCGYGDKLATVEIVNLDSDEQTELRLRGHGDLGQRQYEDSSFYGAMSTSGFTTSIINTSGTDVYLFPSKKLVTSPHLDRDVRGKTSAELEDRDDDDGHKILCLRSEALGTVTFPEKGGIEKKRASKRPKWGFSSMDPYRSCTEEDEDEGPRIIALKGKYLVGGFSNGAIVASPTLPESFDDTTRGFGLDSSCSKEQGGCCEAHCPQLEEYEGSHVGGPQVQQCTIS